MTKNIRTLVRKKYSAHILIISMLAITVVGYILVIRSAAATSNISLETENSQITGIAQNMADSSASENKKTILHATTEYSGSPKIIFDTDMGNDIDDAMALAMIHSYQKLNKAELIAVTVSINSPWAAPFTDLVNTYYGNGTIPIGSVRGANTPVNDGYIRQLSEAKNESGGQQYPHDLLSGDSGPSAVQVLRQTLAAQPDQSVVFVTVGFSTNLSHLLQSEPDSYSQLNGKELVAQKVTLLSNMAGAFNARFREFNVISDEPAARYMYANWPTPIVSSGFEIGDAIIFPGAALDERITYTDHHPIKDAFKIYNHQNRQTWDLTSVIEAIEPGIYFKRSEPGKIVVDEGGNTIHSPSTNGKHYYLVRDGLDTEKAKNHMIDLVTQAP